MSDVRQRHANHFTALAEKAEPQLTSTQRKPWLAQLQAEHNNLRAALTWLIRERADAAGALRLAGALPWMWYFGGHFSEGRSWLKQALELAGADQHIAPKAKALVRRVSSGHLRRRYGSGALSWRTEVPNCGAPPEIAEVLAFALFHEGVASILRSEQDHARVVLKESLECFRELDDSWGTALATTYFGITWAYGPGTEDEARPVLAEGRARFQALARRLGTQHVIALSGQYRDATRKLCIGARTH